MKSKRKFSLALTSLVMIALIFSCRPDPEVTPLNSEIQLSLGDIYFGESGANGGRVNAITWSHVLGGTGSITFNNQDNDYSATYPVDGSNLGAGSYTVPNGTYDISLDMNSATPADFIPYTASLSSQVISANQTLTFDANTSFGLVLLGLDSLDQTVTPSFNVSGTDYDLTLDAVQEFYYLYVPGAATGTLTATETFYNQSLSVDVNVTTSTIHAYAFKLVTSDAGISVNFTDFTVEENDWDIDAIPTLFTFDFMSPAHVANAGGTPTVTRDAPGNLFTGTNTQSTPNIAITISNSPNNGMSWDDPRGIRNIAGNTAVNILVTFDNPITVTSIDWSYDDAFNPGASGGDITITPNTGSPVTVSSVVDGEYTTAVNFVGITSFTLSDPGNDQFLGVRGLTYKNN